MACIARTLGAPDSVPAGNVARTASKASRSARRRPSHLRHEVHHVGVALDAVQQRPLDAARPRPPGPRRCARGPRASRARRAPSRRRAGPPRARRRAPGRPSAAGSRRAAGSRPPSRTRTSSSGEAPRMERPGPEVHREQVGRRVDAPERPIDRQGPRAGHLKRRAGTAWSISPAWMSSTSFATPAS